LTKFSEEKKQIGLILLTEGISTILLKNTSNMCSNSKSKINVQKTKIMIKRPTKKVKKLENKIKEVLKDIKWATETSRVKFNYLAGLNRPIFPSHVTKITKSVSLLGMLAPVICTELDFFTGKKELYVLDKQHGLNACLRLGINIPYIIIPIRDRQELVEVLALLNASSKPWSMLDYVTAWSSLNPSYVSLNKYYETYDFELTLIAAVLSESTCLSGGSMSTTIKKGEFKIVNEERNVKILKYVTDMLNVLPRMNRFENRYAISEYVSFLRTNPTYVHDKFIINLKKNKDKFILATQEQGALSLLFKKIS
jgi:hypothetical protein